MIGLIPAPSQNRIRSWLSRDPSGERGGMNLYEYCADNPVNGNDPSGLAGLGIGFSGLPTYNNPINWGNAAGTLNRIGFVLQFKKCVDKANSDYSDRKSACSKLCPQKQPPCYNLAAAIYTDDMGVCVSWLGFNIGGDMTGPLGGGIANAVNAYFGP